MRHDLLVSDAAQVAGTISRDIVFAALTLNRGVPDPRRVPRMGFDTREPEDLKLYSEALPSLAGIGLRIPRAWAQDKLRIPEPDKNEDVLSVPNPEMVVPPALRKKQTQALPAAARVALKAGSGETSDVFDVFSDDLSADWERVTDPLVSPVDRLISECSSYEEFLRRLPEAVDQMDTAELTEALAKGLFAANSFGRVGGA